MVRRVKAMPKPVLAGLLVFAMSFALYAFSTQPLTGYEPETGAVTEGLVLEGHFWDKEDSPLPMKADVVGPDGHHYSRTGILQPMLMAPFFAAGHAVDETIGHFDDYPNGYTFLWFYNPFIAALAALALFALVYQARRSLKWATTIAVLFTVASIAWPYSKIGMETTFMAAIMVAFAVAYWARSSPLAAELGADRLRDRRRGRHQGLLAASRCCRSLILLWPAFAALERREKLRLAIAVCLPVLLWIGVVAWYNWSRFGDPTSFGYSESPLTKSAPLNFFGLLFSPGKGLIFYSPLVVLGALGAAAHVARGPLADPGAARLLRHPQRDGRASRPTGGTRSGGRATSSRPPGRCSCRSPGGRRPSPAQKVLARRRRPRPAGAADRDLRAVLALHRTRCGR